MASRIALGCLGRESAGLVPVATAAHSALRSPKSCLGGFVCRIRACDERKQEETFLVHAPTGPDELKPGKQACWVGRGINLRARPLLKTFKFKFSETAVNGKGGGTEAASVLARTTPGLSRRWLYLEWVPRRAGRP